MIQPSVSMQAACGGTAGSASKRPGDDEAWLARAQALLASVPRNGRIVEIGPLFNPIAPKAAGYDTAVVDHLPRDDLVAVFAHHPAADVNRIEEVDFVWRGGPLSDVIPAAQHGTFDAFVASHVIEHTPDMIAFLDSAAVVLKPDGVVILVVPDKRYCFDYFQPLTTTGQLLEAHARKQSRHSSRLAFDHFAYNVEDGGNVAWGQRPLTGLRLTSRLEEARDKFEAFDQSSTYIDLHAWRFVPASFELLLLELARLGETDWFIERITPAQGSEFFAWLRRGGAARVSALSDEELDVQRLTLLKRVLFETRTQVDWLTAAEPDLAMHFAEPSPAEAESMRLRDRVAALDAELVLVRASEAGARAERDAVLSSGMWRATEPLRQVVSALPPSARSILRTFMGAQQRRRHRQAEARHALDRPGQNEHESGRD